MENVLIVGSNGLLGRRLYPIVNKKFKVTKFIRSSKKNFLNKKFCKIFFKKRNFDIIIFLNAITNIDYCESNKKEALNINYQIVVNVENAVRVYGFKTFFLYHDQKQAQ